MITEEFFGSRSLASQAAAQRIASAVNNSLVDAPETSIIVTGGSSPEECYELLAETKLPWHKVHIILSDDRCVPADHRASNEGLVRQLLLTGRAANARLVPIYEDELPPGDQCKAFVDRLDSVPLPFSISLLGMGADGHIASLFPDFAGLENGLDPDGEDRCLTVKTAASSHPRISLTMATLIQSRETLLLFFGDDKREVYERAKLEGGEYPVGRLLQQEQTPVRVCWAP